MKPLHTITSLDLNQSIHLDRDSCPDLTTSLMCHPHFFPIWQPKRIRLFRSMPTLRASQVALAVKNLPANAGDKRRRLDPWVRKIPWRNKRQPTPVFLPGESHGQRSLGWAVESIGLQRVGHHWRDLAHAHSLFHSRHLNKYFTMETI